MLRILLGANAMAMVAALIQVEHWHAWMSRFVEMAATVEPLLLVALGALALLRDVLRRLPLRLGQLAVLALVASLAWGQAWLWRSIGLADGGDALRAVLLGLIAAAVILAYFELRARAFSPSQAEARLAALNARIRPHFLFNSLNAVLSLIRARPQEAEAVLESLSDLFRAAMRDPGEQVSLADEIALGEQYLALEKLRLGERLRVEWQIGTVPMSQPIPPLMLQPLLENAVYHGVEPAPEGGTIRVAIQQQGDTLCLAIANPTTMAGEHAKGNQIALANIRERLALYYDLEARLEIEVTAGHYEVRIFLPCRKRHI